MNIERAKAILEKDNIKCLVGTSLQNVYYLTGFTSFLKQVTPNVPVFGALYWSRSPKSTLIAPYSEADVVVATSESRFDEVRLYGSFPLELSKNNLVKQEKTLYSICSETSATDAPTALASLLQDLGMDSSTIALDEGGLPFGMFEQIKSLLPNTNIIPAAKLLSSIRMIKTNEETKKLREVVSVTEKAIKKSASLVKPGQTTLAIAKEIESIEQEASAKPIFTVVASGKHRAFPNAPPTRDKLSGSDIVRFDIGCNLSGYCSDLGRTLQVKEAKKEVRIYYNAILEGLEMAIEHAVPGVKASDIFQIAVETVRKRGIKHYRRHHTGHGIGLEVYDPPTISPNDSTILEEGMVVNLETPYYELGFTGLIVEDCILIRKKHSEILSRLPKTLDGF